MKYALEQIKALKLKQNYPTVICDVDEVICHFISDFILYAKTRNYTVTIQNYSLFGNIFDNTTNKAIPYEKISRLIDSFFSAYVSKQKLVKGAKKNLQEIAKKCQIIILTNISHHYAEKRRSRLTELGINHPMISSSGPKGILVKEIAKLTSSNVFFIDDIPYHINSVAKECPEALRLHYIADEKHNKSEPMAEYGNYKCKDWEHIKDIILNHLQSYNK